MEARMYYTHESSYTQSFDVNEIITINNEIKLFVEHGSASQTKNDLTSNKICDQFYKSGKRCM